MTAAQFIALFVACDVVVWLGVFSHETRAGWARVDASIAANVSVITVNVAIYALLVLFWL